VLLLRGSVLGLETIKMLCREIREAQTLDEARNLAVEIDDEVSSLIKRHEMRIGVLTSEQGIQQ
jgi:hypothetical protein